jgi:uncharacterized protein (DUF302 family)
MSYYINKKISGPSFDEVEARLKEELKKEGFGVLTEIDMKTTLRKKLDVDFRPYKILGACNPHFAYQALQKEEKIGVFLPCNVIIEQSAPEVVSVSAVDPIASMISVDNSELGEIAQEIQAKLKRVIDQL